MEFAADLDQFPITAALQILGSGSHSGVATISGASPARVVFREGRVVYANRASAGRLGERLLGSGLLTREHLDRALALQSELDRHCPLASILVEMEYVDRKTIERETRNHIIETTRALLRVAEGQLQFRSARIDDHLVVLEEGVPVSAILLDAVATAASDCALETDDETELELLAFVP